MPPALLVSVLLPEEPIVLPELEAPPEVEPDAEGEVVDEEALPDGDVVELELPVLPEVPELPDGLAPIEVPLLLGELAEELDVSVELLPLALGELALLPLVLGELALLPLVLGEVVLLEPDAPIVELERSFGFVVALGELVLLPEAGELAEVPPAALLPPVLLPELWAMAKPPKARAAAAATVVRVVLIICNYSLIELPTKGRGWNSAGKERGAGWTRD